MSMPGSHLVLIFHTRGDNQAALSLRLQRTELLSELQSMSWAYSRLAQGRGEVGLQKEGFLGPLNRLHGDNPVVIYHRYLR